MRTDLITSRSALLALAAVLCTLGGGGAAAQSGTLSLPAQVGRALFFDTNLSASRQMSCASCHDPHNHYSPSNSLSVQLGGPNLSLPGTRNVPTLTYKEFTPPYDDNAPNPDGVSTNAPGGGFTWDGRADTLSDQARIPLLAPNEMANGSVTAVVQTIMSASYASLFQQAFGASVFADPQTAFEYATAALAEYELEDPSFHAYSSKYDLYAGNKIGGNLTAAETRGFAVFNDPNRGNCGACHFSGAGFDGSVAQFTDFTYEAIGLPRNTAIPANVSRFPLPMSYDLGICSRPDHPVPANAAFCGMFKVPTLRNVATRNSFFHNGEFHTLQDALRFYNQRDTSPQSFYPLLNGVVQKYNDLPTVYRVNIDPQVPLDGRPAGSTPPMSDQDLADLACFLDTLTDGYVPGTTPTAAGCTN